MPANTVNIVRFGDLSLDLRTGELHKKGLRVRLQGQPFQVLVLLLREPGELVTREELRKQLWPLDTFVDFDDGLNAAVRKLRQVLGDSAERPRYIETLPRRGYRFIGRIEPDPANAVQEQGAAKSQPPVTEKGNRPLAASKEADTAVSDRPRKMVGVERMRMPLFAVAAFITAALGGAILVRFLRPSDPPRPKYTQLTNFADSAVAPALSRDGRMLAFIRGEYAFEGPGEIYLELLPKGEPVQLTHDGLKKMGPLVFSPDGSRISYTVGINDTWTVPLLGGEPSHWLANAGGLSWATLGPVQHEIMYSALTGQGIHMGLYTSTENRTGERAIYLPKDVNGMAHRSFLSPDGRSVLLAEMDMSGWLPCRLVPFDGSWPGQRVGPQPSQCTDAAWSPDGRWMYFCADTGDGFHIWRQLYPKGTPEQVTFGATEEQGLALTADGRSFLTSMGEKQSTIWIHDLKGDRQITSQGYALLPSFSSDGKRLFYLQRSRANRRFLSGELWAVTLETRTQQRLLLNFVMEHYNVAADGNHIVFVSVDDASHSSVWIATLDGRYAPRCLSSLDSVRALFGVHDDVYFVGGETLATSFLYHVNSDGTNLQRVVPSHILFLYDISPDGKWVAVWEGMEVVLYSTDGTSRRVVCSNCATAGGEDRDLTPPLVSWSRDGKRLYFHVLDRTVESHKTYFISLRPGQTVPDLPDSGFPSIEAAAISLGGRLVSEERAFLGANSSVYAFVRRTTHRNIFRIQIP